MMKPARLTTRQVQELNRQQEAIEESLRQQMNQKLEQLRLHGQFQSAAGPQGGRLRQILAAARPEIYFLVLAVLVFWQLREIKQQLHSQPGGQNPQQSGPVVPGEPEVAEQRDGVASTIAPAIDSVGAAEALARERLGFDGNWAASWQRLASNEPELLAGWLEGVANADGLAEDQVSP
jgi:hypothetical protein